MPYGKNGFLMGRNMTDRSIYMAKIFHLLVALQSCPYTFITMPRELHSLEHRRMENKQRVFPRQLLQTTRVP